MAEDNARVTTSAPGSLASWAPPHRAGSYTTEVISGPRGPLAIYHFAVEKRQARRILVLKLDHYGDLLIGLPALKKLRQVFPADHITLVCGSWNSRLAKKVRVADEVLAYDFFPENPVAWNGEPFERLERFHEICRESFDIAIDLRVDEDTRFLLGHVEATIKCGIGARASYPFLDIVLPPPIKRRETDGRWLLIEPDRFETRMPFRRPLFHETDFSITNTHLIYGPYLLLPEGQLRAHFGLRLLTPLPRFPGVKIVIDVARGARSEQLVAARRIKWTHSGDPRVATLEFTNDQPDTIYELRIHARGQPLFTRLRFFGVRLELNGLRAPGKPSELHIGEQLSLLVDLVEQRIQKPYSDNLSVGESVAFDFLAMSGLGASAKRIVVAPISNADIKDWGIANYTRLVALLLERSPCYVVLVGSKAQRGQLERIVEENGRDRRVINIAGSTDWCETSKIVSRADLVISNNSGLGHLGAACGVPTLTIYSGNHQPTKWGPRGDNAHAMTALVPCSPCKHHKLEQCPNDHLCMKRIAPESVADQAFAMLWG